MADWEQIERDFKKEFPNTILHSQILDWFKQRLESEYTSVEKLSEEENNEFHTNVTAEIKVKYGKA